MLYPFRTRFFRRLAAVLALGALPVVASAVAGSVACSSSGDDTTLPAVTGVIVQSESLTRSLGCGVDGNQMYRYALAVVDATGTVAASGIYDCFADARVQDLPPADGGVGGALDFTIKVYAFNKASYDAQSALFGSTPQDVDNWFRDEAPNTARTHVTSLQPTWSVLCTATQQREVRVLAVCGEASIGTGAFNPDGGALPSSGSFIVPLDTLTTESGSPVYCDERFFRSTLVAHATSVGAQSAGLADFAGGLPCAPPSTLVDAGAPVVDAGDGGDGGDGGDAGAAPPPPPPVIPTTFTATPAVAPARFAIDVTIFDALDLPSRTVQCTADTSGGVTTRAVCGTVRDAL